ncbi:MAG: peptidoglycan DD-metalloendopeptidase family protein [Phototrophicaceae bacterium]
MADVKRYQVIDGPLSIRTTANGNRTGKSIAQGEQITVTGEPVTAGDYIWVQHDTGWSAISTADQTDLYMLDISDRDPNAPRIFRVWSSVLSVRDAANGKRLSTRLYRGNELNIDPHSRTEAGGYIWWQHDKGWSAERNGIGNQIYLKEIFDTPETLPIAEEEKWKVPDTWKGIFGLQVASNGVKVRNRPSVDPRVMIIRYLSRGAVLNCNMDTLIEAEGYFWVRHDLGWSAICSSNAQVSFLGEPGTIPGLIAIGADGPAAEDLPGYRQMITQLPVRLDDIQWFQYFGNNMFAMRNGKSYGYDRYSQGVHGGLDFGNSRSPKPIYAGVEAEFVKIEYPSRNNTRIYLKKDDYIFIYQHITSPRQFNKGDKVMPDTQLGLIEHHSINNGWDHLHFEVRFMKSWIINPLLLFTEDIYNQLIGNFNPEKANTSYKRDFPKSINNFFYHTDTWHKWVTPLDQPMIKLAGELIGPRGELDKADW